MGKQKLKWATAAIALVFSAFAANAGYNDPVKLSAFIAGDGANQEFVDLDNDGDQDIVIGNADGTIDYIENTGNGFITAATNPFNAIDVGDNAAPDFVDIDGDSDLDLFVGNSTGTVQYFRNNSGTFVEITGASHPLDGIDFGSSSSPEFADIDGDSDPDLLVGNSVGVIVYYENNGGTFTQLTGASNPFDGIDVGDDADAEVIDFDGDGDLDLFIGEKGGVINFYDNVSGVYTVQTGGDNPFTGVDVGSNSHPAVLDVDGDADLDMVIGEAGGTTTNYLNYLENVGGTFTAQRGTNNPFEGVRTDRYLNPVFVDVDNDADLDIVSGTYDGNILYFNNDGGAFIPMELGDNPFDAILVDTMSKADVADIDGDMDLDLVIGDENGQLRYFVNETGSYVEVTGAANPFNGFDVGGNSTPDLGDIDGDGDLDLFVGEKDGYINYYRNISGTYTVQTGANNPFDGVDVGTDSRPTLVDFDGDGDLDMLIGAGDGTVDYYENNGGTFTALTGTDNPANGIDFGGNSTPILADFDGDGDLDLYSGNSNGEFLVSEYMTPGVSVDIGSGLTTTEAGGTALFSVVLESQPSGNVVISLSSSNTDEGTVAPATMTFTTGNWNVAQVATITGVDDYADDGNQSYTIDFSVASPDVEYDGMSVSSVSVTNVDNDDPAGISVTGSGLTTTEAGGTATITVVLDDQPSGDVVIALASDDTGEGTVSPASLTFTNGNWNVSQDATVTGVDDSDADGDQSYSITFTVTSTDPEYNGFSVPSVSVTNEDDESTGIDPVSLDDINVFSYDNIVVLEAGEMVIEKVEIFNISGRMVESEIIQSSGRHEISLPDGNGNIYIVRVYGNGEITTKKVLVQ